MLYLNIFTELLRIKMNPALIKPVLLRSFLRRISKWKDCHYQFDFLCQQLASQDPIMQKLMRASQSSHRHR